MPEQTIILNVTYTVSPTVRDVFVHALRDDGVLGRVRQETGCLQYELFLSVEDPARLILVEQWDSKANMDAHITGVHFKTMQAIEKAYVTDVDVKQFLH